MCIAIYKPADKAISREVLEICAENNADGCGFAYVNTDEEGNRKLKIGKSLDFDTFYRKYERAQEISPDSPFIIHFRIKTHGPIDVENCHPFRVDDNHVFIHNGMIKGMETSTKYSDTNMFNRNYMAGLPEGWMDSDSILKMISHIIDYGKIVLLNIDGDVQICNENKGEWVDGCWYSNTSYKKSTYNYTSSNRNWHTGYNHNIGSKRSVIKTAYSFEKCDRCGKTVQVQNLTSYYDGGLPLSYCTRCDEPALKEFPNLEQYIITTDCLVDYLNEFGDKAFDNYLYAMTEPWVNPWDLDDKEEGEVYYGYDEESGEMIEYD